MLSTEKIQETLERVSRWYIRAMHTTRDDLIQEGWATVLELDLSSVPPDYHDAYIARAASRRMARYCWGNSAGVHHPNPSRQNLEHITTTSFGETTHAQQGHAPDPEMELMMEEAMELVPELRARLAERATHVKVGRLSPDLRTAALKVLLGGQEPATVATSSNLTRRAVYKATERTKAALAADRETREILSELRAYRPLLPSHIEPTRSTSNAKT